MLPRERLVSAITPLACRWTIMTTSRSFSSSTDGKVLSLTEYLRQFVNYESAGVPANAGVRCCERITSSSSSSSRESELLDCRPQAMTPQATAAAGVPSGSRECFDLRRMHRLMDALGSPVRDYKVREYTW